MQQPPHEWLLKRRHEELSQNFRLIWDLYIKFYTVFLTFSVAGLSWVLTHPRQLAELGDARFYIALVFAVQTILTAVTSAAVAVYSRRMIRDQRRIERELLKSDDATTAIAKRSVPLELTDWSGWANFVAMVAMAWLWVTVGMKLGS